MASTWSRTTRRFALGAMVLAVAVLPMSRAEADPSAPGLVVSTDDSVPELEWFDGPVAGFYQVPDPLPAGAPGTLIRAQAVSANAASTTVRIMYHSRDALDRDRAVTGMLTYPNAAPPPGGWPVVSHGNGTVGLDGHCALSRRGAAVSSVGQPAVAVASDYIGMGPVGERHPYLSRASEGHSVIDAVRAARNLTAAGAGDRWLAIGGSQGGHAVLAASELAGTYAPELDLLGTVAYAPGAMFDRSYGGIDDLVSRVVGAMMLYGVATETPGVDPHDYVSEAGRAVDGAFVTGCTGEITAAVLSVPFDQYYEHDPATTEPARSTMLANDVGHVAADSPVLIAQGTADLTVVPQRTRDLLARMCATGQVTEYLEVEGADHGTIGGRTVTEVVAWLQARLAGEPARTSCAPDPGPFTARYPTAVCASLDRLAAARGGTRADVLRDGVRLLGGLAATGQALPAPTGPPQEGPCEVVVDWPADELAAVADTAQAWGVTGNDLHHGAGRLVLAIVWALHVVG